MRKKRFELWSEEQISSRNKSAIGTFHSCHPGMTFYRASTDHFAGCVIICPGGGYENKMMSYEGTDVAKALNDNGIHAFVLDYRIKPDYHPAPLADALRAVELARELSGQLGYKSDKIAMLGFSAGGHLAACAATMWTSIQERPDAAVLCYPVISMEQHFHAGCRANLIGEKGHPNVYSDLSCENRVDRQSPPVFMWHTADDTEVSVEHSLLFASALSAKKVPFELHVYPSGEHGLGLASSNPIVYQWFPLCVKWLGDIGFKD